MLTRLAAACLLLLPALPASASDLIRVESPHSVIETADRLEAAVTEAGAQVVARVPHSAAAESVGVTIPDNQVLIFGNPKIGSPVIAAAPESGLDLPMRVVVFDQDGQTVLAYRDPADLAELYGLPADHPSIVAMTGALAKLTAAAAAE